MFFFFDDPSPSEICTLSLHDALPILDVDDINDILAIKLLGIVPDDEEIIISTNKGEPAVLNNHSKAGEAFRNIVRRMEGEEVPFMSVNGEPGLFGRFLKLLNGK